MQSNICVFGVDDWYLGGWLRDIVMRDGLPDVGVRWSSINAVATPKTILYNWHYGDCVVGWRMMTSAC